MAPLPKLRTASAGLLSPGQGPSLTRPAPGCYGHDMLTTRQLVDMMDGACTEGLAFADAHPDPEEAISYALSHAELDPARTDDHVVPSRPTQESARVRTRTPFVGHKSTEDHPYRLLGLWDEVVTAAENLAHLEGCARILREWVAKMPAEHAAKERS